MDFFLAVLFLHLVAPCKVFRNPNPENCCLWTLESGIQLKESGIALTIEIWNSSCTDKNSESTACNPESKTLLDYFTQGKFV